MKRSPQRIAKLLAWIVVVVSFAALAAQADARTAPIRPATHACQAAATRAARAVVRWNELGGNLSQANRRSGLDYADAPAPVQLPMPTGKAC